MNREQMKDLDRWFAEMHQELYKEHTRLSGKGDWYCAFLEAAMGAHDRAWCKYLLEIPFEIHQEVLKEMKEEEGKR